MADFRDVNGDAQDEAKSKDTEGPSFWKVFEWSYFVVIPIGAALVAAAALAFTRDPVYLAMVIIAIPVAFLGWVVLKALDE